MNPGASPLHTALVLLVLLSCIGGFALIAHLARYRGDDNGTEAQDG